MVINMEYYGITYYGKLKVNEYISILDSSEIEDIVQPRMSLRLNSVGV